MMNQNQTQQPLYRADLLRAQKSAQQLKIGDIVDKSKELGGTIAYGTVQSILKGESRNPKILSLWAIAQILGVPFKAIFDFDQKEAN